MPHIVEIREIDGECWVRIDRVGDEGSITLWTDEEKNAFARDVRLACAEIAERNGKLSVGHTNIAAGYAAAARAIARKIREDQ